MINKNQVQVNPTATGVSLKVEGVFVINVDVYDFPDRRKVVFHCAEQQHAVPAVDEQFVGVILGAITSAGVSDLTPAEAYAYGARLRTSADKYGRVWTYRVKPGTPAPNVGDGVNVLGGVAKYGKGLVVSLAKEDPRARCAYVYDVAL